MKKYLSMKYVLLMILPVAVVGIVLQRPFGASGASSKLAKPSVEKSSYAGSKKPASASVKSVFETLPLYFIEQPLAKKQTGYVVQGKDKSLYFSPQGISIALDTPLQTANQAPPTSKNKMETKGGFPADNERQRWIVKLEFIGANPHVLLSGAKQTAAQISYFSGGAKDLRTGMKTYSSITYHDLWPGIDLVYSGTAAKIKHEFIVHPGADPKKIKLAWRGASSVSLNDAGQMNISTPLTAFTDDTPYSYQEIQGQKNEVTSSYAIQSTGSDERQIYGFNLGSYDASQTLVIDPATIIYCGYIGGGSEDMALDVAVDASGYAYVAGVTYSNTTTQGFPATVGPDLTFNGGDRDAFVAKVKLDGTGLVYCGYIGGVGNEYANGIAVDNLGRAYVTGVTTSDRKAFPVKFPDFSRTGPILDYKGGGDAFIARVNVAGTALEYCGYLGGTSEDVGMDVAVDANYNAYIVGNTSSTDYPGLIGPDLTFNGNSFSSDAFVTKVSGSGSMIYSGFIGGTGWDFGYAIAVDTNGNAYITGQANSDQTSFPVTVGPRLVYSGNGESFVAKVNSSGASLLYCGYITDGVGQGIAVNGAGEAYVCGSATVNSAIPVINGPAYIGSLDDAFVSHLRADGTGFLYHGYIGGTGSDSATAIALDSLGRAYITGVKSSSNFPTYNGPDATYNGGEDVFVTCLSGNGAVLGYSTYLGGSGQEYATGIGVAPTSSQQLTFYGAPVIVVGRTTSTPSLKLSNNPFPVKNGPSLTYRGGPNWGDAFAAKISPEDVNICCVSNP